jgi:hypothetical protein
MQRRTKLRRGAFTLLEMILSLSIGMLLLFGLYTSLDVFLNATKAGRAQVDEAQLARGVLNKFQNDISQCVVMLNNVNTLIANTTNVPQTVSDGFMMAMDSAATASSSTSSSSTAAATTGTTGATTGTTGGTSTSSTAGTTGASSGSTGTSSGSGSSSSATPSTLGAISVSATGAASTPAATQTQYFPYNLGVQGTQSYVSVFTTKSPKAVEQALGGNSAEQALDCDLRRITYWVDVSGGPEHGGLYRQEIGRQGGDSVTDLNLLTSSMPPEVSDPSTMLVAKGILEATFQYWDGANWLDTWDGTTVNTYDEVTPTGPPVAVKINIKIARKDVKQVSVNDPKSYREFSQVVSIPTAVNYQNYQNSIQYQNAQTLGISLPGG